MKFNATDFSDVWLIEPAIFKDVRGFFCETYSTRPFFDHGITDAFVQDNHSFSATAGVLRGLHFQRPPFAQSKLIRVLTGAITDIIVDLRPGSPTYRRWQAFELSAENMHMLYVPRGFAHGFCTGTDNTAITYKVDNYYSPQHDGGVRWNDPQLGIVWPTTTPLLSAKDEKLPLLSQIELPF